ncbi:MAG: hypothetical protein V4547_08175 [Bacteroidota bacterium]
MEATIGKWLKIALINLCVVALLGVTLRYKIAFSLPFIDQKNLLHGHSHFAFSGWITQAIMILLVYYLYKHKQENLLKRYAWIVFANLIISYGMLLSFAIQGYSFFSILFSTLCIFVSYVFAIQFWKDLNKLNINRNAHLWFKAALVFSVISSVGPFCLAYMMSNHLINQKFYLASVYYFLHFQYNGWFLFGCMGLFISKLFDLIGEEKRFKTIFWIFALSCVPSYFLSALWLPIPKAIYVVVVISAVMQLVAWVWFVKIIWSHIPTLKKEIPNPGKWLMAIAGISMSIKLILQLGSTLPALSQLAFGFRPIVIGYLHLVLLALFSIFLLGYIFTEKVLVVNRMVTIGILIFVTGVFVNEILLMTQGIFALATESIPHISELLLIAAIVIFTGIFLINIKQFPSAFLKK